ncbi:hypothetical protein EOM39_07965, partial [Candidatus Gracilibacteria bacterium]|nr:hypothetical protein [Candidatus Gracilibacteria bacterium]
FFGSFASVIIHRLKSKEGGIIAGRSKCPNCQTTLGVTDLMPIVSYFFRLGKCGYCKQKISPIYPLLELSTGILFFLVGYNLIDFSMILTINYIEIIKLFYFLFLAFITIIFVFYDILYLEINEGVLFIGILFSGIIIVIQTIFPDVLIIPTFSRNYEGILGYELYGLIGLFIVIILSLYIIILKGLKEIYDMLILTFCILSIFVLKEYFNIDIYHIPVTSSILGLLFIFTFLFLQIVVSKGTWMGGGDLRIAILMGLILGYSYSFVGIMIAYILGSIIGLFIILLQKLKKKETISTIIPFGPFLGLGLFISILFQKEINEWLFYYL